MKRLALLTSTLSLLAVAACASPNEAEIAATAQPAAETVAVLEAAPVEASITALPSAPALIQVSADAEDALVMPVTYSCAGGRSFVATFPEHGRAVTIAAAGETRVLAHKGEADAAMFADGAGATLTAEGAGATLTGLGATYADCMAG